MSTTTLVCLGHNPGQFAVKNTYDSPSGKRAEAMPFPAVIAPYAASDSLGLVSRTAQLSAMVNGAHYLGGATVARLPNAIRQMANGRLEEDSPIYPALVQMSLQHTKLDRRGGANLPVLVIATALPVGWRNADENAGRALEAHIRAGLKGKAEVKAVFTQSEPAAVIYHEVITDEGEFRKESRALTTDLVAVADIGGGTLNRSMLEALSALPGQSQSPPLGSRQAIEPLMQLRGLSFVDAELALREAAAQPGRDAVVDNVLKQYRAAVVAELQQAWGPYRPKSILIAGGTAHWVGGEIIRAFGATARIVEHPQQAIATGLWRYAKRQAAKIAARG